MPKPNIDTLAKIVWDYHHMQHQLQKCDAIFALCSLDKRVATRAAQLFLDGLGDYLIFSGGVGALTQDRFTRPEADIFADIAKDMGVPEDKIIIEDESTNTGQNVQLTHKLLEEKGLKPKSFILVQKPYMERRTYATFKKQWPDDNVEILVTSPQISYENYFNGDNPKELVINIMVGDLQRIKEYPAKGFQIPQIVPDDVWQANQQLIAMGYNKHLI